MKKIKLNRHVGSLGCYTTLSSSNVVGRQSTFLYGTTAAVMVFPTVFTLAMYVWWLLLVPLPCCGCLACGKKKKLVMSAVCPSWCLSDAERERRKKKLS
jgi:hypothetical protein